MRQLLSSRRGVALALAVLIVAGGALRADRAAHSTTSYQSADERSYGYLALQIADHGTYGDAASKVRSPLHWPPGAPYMFSLAHRIDPHASSESTYDIPAAYWAQAIVGTLLIGVIFAIGLLLAGSLAGLLGAAAVALYPPLILATGDQLSEPLGALALALAVLALAWATRRPAWWRYGVSGLLFGATALVRADLLLAGGFAALIVLAARWRPAGRLPALGSAAALLAGAALAIAPWTIHATHRAGHFVPVTEGSTAALYVGTYLPGNGTTVGLKRSLGDATRRHHPGLHAVPDLKLPAVHVLDTIASRRPDLSREDALRRETRVNIRKYAIGQPANFASMMVNKVGRMWGRYARGGPRHTSSWIRAWHITLVAVAFAGLLAGLWRRRDPVIGAVLAIVVYSTALHTIVVSQARYNLPLMPVLLVAGLSGLVVALRGRSRDLAAAGSAFRVTRTGPSAAGRRPAAAR